MQIFNQISEIQISNKHLLEAQKHLQLVKQEKRQVQPSRVIEPLFVQRIKSLEYEIEQKIEAVQGVVFMTENDSLIPERVDIREIVGQEIEQMPEWFELAVEKELEKYRPGLNSAVKKLFRSMFSDFEKQNLKKDKLNIQLLIKRMVEFDKSKLSNSQMIELLALLDRFHHAIAKYKKFLGDCAKKLVQFIRQNQQKAVNFSSSNKIYVEDMKSVEEWANHSFPEFRQNIAPNYPKVPIYYQTSNLNYRNASPLRSQHLRTIDGTFYSRRVPTSSGHYNQQTPSRGLSPSIRDMNMRQKLLKDQMARQAVFMRQPPALVKDTGRNFYYRHASSLSKPVISQQPVTPSYPLNNLYRQFYY